MNTYIDWQSYEALPGQFNKQVILITGAASGIGKAVTLELAKQGATILMLDKKVRHLENLYDQISDQGFAEPVILPIDLATLTPESATTLADAVNTDFGQLSGLLHNAAELGSPSPMDQYDMQYWDKVMQTNLQAPYYLTRALLPLLKQSQQTNVLFSSADCGRIPQAYWGAYSIAYAGLEAQMQLWAEELEKVSNIRVNSIDPGPVRTSFRRRSHPGESQQQLITPNAVVPAYLNLLDQNHQHHGQKISLQNSL